MADLFIQVPRLTRSIYPEADGPAQLLK